VPPPLKIENIENGICGPVSRPLFTGGRTSMRQSLDRLRKTLDEAVTVPESTPTEALFRRVDTLRSGVAAATQDIVRAVAEGETAPTAELEELQDGFAARRSKLWFPLRKLLYRVNDIVKESLERVTFLELSRGVSAPCSCALWRVVAKGQGLAAVPSFPTSRVVEEVDDQFDPDSDPSVTRWWAR
jgi:hypothetical protein